MAIATLHTDEGRNPSGTKILSCKSKRRAVVPRWLDLKRISLYHTSCGGRPGDAPKVYRQGTLFETNNLQLMDMGLPAHSLAVFSMTAKRCKAVKHHSPPIFASTSVVVDLSNAITDLRI